MEKCEKLKGYSILISKVRQNINSRMPKEQAVKQAVEECIQQGIESMISNALRNGKTCEVIAEFLEIPLGRVREVAEKTNH